MSRVLALVCLAVALLWGGTARAQDCTQTVELARIQQLLKQAEKNIYLVQPDAATVALDEAESVIPCLSEVVSKEALTQLYLYRGVVAFNQGNEVAATAAFRRALGIDPTLHWNERFGQKARELFLDAKAAVVSTPRGSVRLPVAAPGVVLYLDADPVPPAGGAVDVYAGRHLIQAFKDAVLVAGLWVEVPGGGLMVPPLPPEAGKIEEPRVAPPQTPPDEGGPDRAWMRPVGLGMTGAGGVSLLVGAASGVVYLRTAATLTGGEYYSNRDSEEKESLLRLNKITAYTADVAIPAGAVLAGAGITFLLLSRGDDEGQALTPWIVPGGAGLALNLPF